MNKKIIKFIKKQTCASVCCADENGNSYCFSCYYAFNSEDGLMYFKSSDDTYHFALIKKNRLVAGTVLPDKLTKLFTIGIQFQGDILESQHPLTKDAYIKYHKKYPIGLAIKGEIFTIRLNSVKMTDSRMGIGKKIKWNRASTEINR